MSNPHPNTDGIKPYYSFSHEAKLNGGVENYLKKRDELVYSAGRMDQAEKDGKIAIVIMCLVTFCKFVPKGIEVYKSWKRQRKELDLQIDETGKKILDEMEAVTEDTDSQTTNLDAASEDE